MRLYNSLSGEAEEFAPADGKTVRMYVCGVTPYSATHVGHALSYVAFDVLRRYLEYIGYQVRHVQNFTDVDDKIILRSREEGVEPQELAERYIDDFFRTMDSLNIQRAHVYPRATREMPSIIESIRGLVGKGYAYASGGDVYFRVTSSDGYGKLSHRTLDGMVAGARVEVDPHKEHPMDFVLWKEARPGEPAWDSPWGPGRPGWHIECTSMSISHLGTPIDIHGGGQDLIFPHHENEIAQSEACTGVRPFSRFWVHNGLLRLGEDKMSKSLGNLVSLADALERYRPDSLRLYFLSSHYRSSLQFSDEGCAAMQRSAERILEVLRRSSGGTEPLDVSPFRNRFLEAMDDDLNTPRALAALFDLAREINRYCAVRDVTSAQETLRDLGAILGLTFEERGNGGGDPLTAKPFIELLLETRTKLRQTKQYALADWVRGELERHGVKVEDTPEGVQWEYHPRDGR